MFSFFIFAGKWKLMKIGNATNKSLKETSVKHKN